MSLFLKADKPPLSLLACRFTYCQSNSLLLWCVYSFTVTMAEEDAALRCSNALYLDLALDEVFRRLDELLDQKNLDTDVANDVKARLRLLMRKLVHKSVVFDEEEGPDKLTVEGLLEQKMREVADLRATVPARIRRRLEEVVNPNRDSDKRA